MASILKVDDLRGNTAAGNITITSEGGAATQSLQQGLNKAWVYLSTTAYTVSNSLNIASSIDNGTGRPEVNFTNSFNNVYIAASGSAYNRTIGEYSADGGITTGSYAHSLFNVGSFADTDNLQQLGLKYSGDLA